MNRHFDTIVIGGGLNGLATAWQLTRMGCPSVALLEQFDMGHDYGSSHGKSRIIRSSYPDADLVRLMEWALEHDWAALENAYGSTLIHRMTGCLFGPEGGLFDDYARAVEEAGANVELLNDKQAAKRFSAFRFQGLNALADHSAGLIDAERTINALKSLAVDGGCQLFAGIKVEAMDLSNQPMVIETSNGNYHAEHLVIAAGAWTGRLIPELNTALKVIRQTVGYFEPDIKAPLTTDELPVWAYLGVDENDVYFGLPEFGRPGLKAAKHKTTGSADDPDVRKTVDKPTFPEIEAWVSKHLKIKINRALESETCLYTMTPSHNFVIDNYPLNPNVSIGAGFSGHGFKFGPLTGKLLAELAMKQDTSVELFNRMREKFSLSAATSCCTTP